MIPREVLLVLGNPRQVFHFLLFSDLPAELHQKQRQQKLLVHRINRICRVLHKPIFFSHTVGAAFENSNCLDRPENERRARGRFIAFVSHNIYCKHFRELCVPFLFAIVACYVNKSRRLSSYL